MERTSTTRAYDNDQREVLSIELGGTGVTSAIDAPQAFGAVATDLRGHANGIATLDRSTKIPPYQLDFIPGVEMPSIGGSNTAYTFTTPSFMITNFDSQIVYNVHANHGMITMNNDEIVYHAPSTPCIDVLQVNNNVTGINVLASYHEKPTLTFPANNATNILTYPVIQLDSLVWVGYQDEQAAIEWEITEQGETPVVETKVDRQLHYTPSYGLKLSTVYSARARVSGYLTGTGVWSDPITFTTTNIATPMTEVAQLHAFPETGTTQSFGRFSVDVSSDAKVIVTSDPRYQFADGLTFRIGGRVFIYSYENNVWVKNAIESGVTDDVNFQRNDYLFGQCIALSANKQRILVLSAWNPDLPITSYSVDPIGDIRIYETVTPDDYSVMALIAHYPGTTINEVKVSQSLASGFVTTPNFETIAHGVFYSDTTTAYSNVRILNFDTVDTITLDTEIQRSFPSNTESGVDWGFGEQLDLSADGQTLLVYTSRRVTNTYSAGAIVIYKKTNNIWTQDQILESDDNQADPETWFGYPVQFSPDDTKIVTFSNSAADNTGHVYLFEEINNIWTKTKKLDLPEMQNAQLGGEAYQFRFNQIGTLLLMSSPWQSTPTSALVNGAWDSTGVCYLFDISGPEIIFLHMYTPSDALNTVDGAEGQEFGESIAFSEDDTTVVITSPWRDWSGNGQNAGTIYVYK